MKDRVHILEVLFLFVFAALLWWGFVDLSNQSDKVQDELDGGNGVSYNNPITNPSSPISVYQSEPE